MPTTRVEIVPAEAVELLDARAYTAEELARACGVMREWVVAHVRAGVLQVDTTRSEWRFDAVTLVRARRIRQLESTFDADLQLAALTADLIEEVSELRRRLQTLVAVQT
jgi:chaperone modulatory protein CbpM